MLRLSGKQRSQMDTTIEFAKKEAGDIPVEFEYGNECHDSYCLKQKAGKYLVSASNARSCLYAVYHILDGKPAGEYKAEFPIRGINPVEALARHSKEQIIRLIDRMGRWRMNTLIIHTVYGWDIHKSTIVRECAKRGINLVFYIYTSLAFLKNCSPAHFAKDKIGKPLYDTLECETRLCASDKKGLEELAKGCREYFTNELTENGDILLCWADGLQRCQCPSCRNLSPAQQWEAVLGVSADIIKQIKPDSKIEALLYVQRYAVPEDLEAYRNIDRVMFDIHRRYRWAALNEIHPEDVNPESEFDPDAVLPTNKYLSKKLKDWRKAFRGDIYIHDNLMLQWTLSCPQPNTSVLLEDLRLYKEFDIQGVVYEAFEPGIESFLPQLDRVAEAMWDLDIDYVPSEIEKWALATDISTGVHYFTRENNFSWDRFKNIFDSVTYTHMKNIGMFLDSLSPDTYRQCVKHVLKHQQRFDVLFIAFSLLQHWQRTRSLDTSTFSEIEKRFAGMVKLWDFMELLDEPYKQTLEVIESTKDRI